MALFSDGKQGRFWPNGFRAGRKSQTYRQCSMQTRVLQIAPFDGFLNIPHIPPPPYRTLSGHKSGNNGNDTPKTLLDTSLCTRRPLTACAPQSTSWTRCGPFNTAQPKCALQSTLLHLAVSHKTVRWSQMDISRGHRHFCQHGTSIQTPDNKHEICLHLCFALCMCPPPHPAFWALHHV